ncbi:MAG: glycosyltransferase family 4 protein [Anaerolineae bacterium]
MRIVMITGEYPPMEGGVGDFTYKLSHALTALKHEVHVLTSGGDAQTQEDGMTVHHKLADWGWGAHAKITRWLQEIQPDVINIQYQAAAYQMRGAINFYPRLQGKHVPAPLVTTFHDLRPPYLFPKAGPLRRWAVYWLAKYSDGIIVTNGADYTELDQHLDTERRPRIKIIHIGSNIAPNPPADYDRDAWRAAHGIGEEDLLLGFFGFLNANKGVETLLQALARLVHNGLPAHLIFIGGRTGSSDPTNREYADSIDRLIVDLGLEARVHRTGFVKPSGVSAALLASDICALPYRDGVSLRRGTLHACLAHGCPIVTTEPSTPLEDLQEGKHMLMVPPEDAKALAEAIRRLWETPELRARLSENATVLAEAFSWERIAAHTAAFFRQLHARG